MVVLKISKNRHRIVGYYFRLPTEKDQFESGCLYKLDCIKHYNIDIIQYQYCKKEKIYAIFFF